MYGTRIPGGAEDPIGGYVTIIPEIVKILRS